MPKINVSEPIKFVLQTIIQAAARANERRARLPRIIQGLALSSLNFNSNPGNVVSALLSFAGLAWSASGKRIWLRSRTFGEAHHCAEELYPSPRLC